MKVRNVNGTSRFSPKGGSWLDYWKEQTGESPYYCAANGCYETDLVGAHVQKVNSIDKCYYIVPLCRSCNQRTDEFEVNKKLVPVPSNL